MSLRQKTPTLPSMLSMTETADLLGLSERTVRRYIASGQLRAHRLGPRMIRVERESVAGLLRPIGGAA